MTTLELVLMATSTLGSGALVVVAKFVMDIRNDAALAVRLLLGEEDVEDDGLVHDVEENSERIDDNSQRISENSQRIDRLQQETQNT